MSNQQVIAEQHLPEDLWNVVKNYTIADHVIVDHPDLVELICRSKSIDTKEEKQNWFNLIPMMNDTQLSKLRDILTREKQKLEEIEEKYEKKKAEIKEKYLWWSPHMAQKNKVQEIKAKEQEKREKEKEEADLLLDQL